MSRSRLTLAAVLVLAGTAAPQATPPHAARGLPGAMPGTERWLVSFATPPLDLSELRAACDRDDAPAAARAVARLELASRRDQAEFVADVETLGGVVVAQFWLVNGCSVEVPRAALARLRADPRVQLLQPDELVHPHGFIRDSTNAANHNADAVQAVGLRGAGTTLAVMDSGLDEAVGRLRRPHRTFYVNGDINNRTGGGIGGSRLLINRQIGKLPADDVNGHGTGVAAVAAGEVWSVAASDRGHAPRASIAGYSIANDKAGTADFTTITKAWQQIAADATARRISVANNSYSGSNNPLHLSQQALDRRAFATGVLPVVSAGNTSGSTGSSQSAANGLAVGATVGGGARTIWVQSARGPIASDARRSYPDLVANGVRVIMPRADFETSNYINTGTSFAAAQVAGAALLFRSFNARARALETKAALLATTDDILGQNRKSPFDNRNAFGLGYLRDDRLIQLARGRNGLVSRAAVTSSSPRRALPQKVVAGHAYAAVITWHRRNTSSLAWSNLDLDVVDGTQVIGTSRTPRNLYEKVVFVARRTGTVNVVVRAVALAQSSVPFGYAFCEVPIPFRRGEVTELGKGCPGTATLQGVSLVLPPVAADRFGNSGNFYPLGGRPHRSQQVYDPAHVPVSFTANGIAFRQDDQSYFSPVTKYWVELQIAMGYSANPPGALSPDFAKNLAVAPTVVLPRQRINLPDFVARNTSPRKWIAIPFQRSFYYRHQAGRFLVVDFHQTANAKGTSNALYYQDAVFDRVNLPVSRVYSLTANATRGFVTPGFGTVLGFSQPRITRAVPRLEAIGVPEVGSSFSVQVTRGLPNSGALLWLGISDKFWGAFRLPFDLTPFGAKGCTIYTDALVTFPAPLSASGTGRLQFRLASNKAWIGLRFFFQAAVLDPRANALGLAYTNALRAVVGG